MLLRLLRSKGNCQEWEEERGSGTTNPLLEFLWVYPRQEGTGKPRSPSSGVPCDRVKSANGSSRTFLPNKPDLPRPNFPWDVQEESPGAQDGTGGTARAAGAAQLQHSWISILGSAAANVEINGFYSGSGCSTAPLNEPPIFPKWRNPILEVSVHLLMALLWETQGFC